MSKKNILTTKRNLFLLVLIFFLLISTYYLFKRQQLNIKSDLCLDPEVGVSVTIPKGWSCHMSEQDGFYIEPPWTEVKPNTGASPQFTIWFKKKIDYSKFKIDPRFCHMEEYSIDNPECPVSEFYYNKDFQINKLTNKKRLDLGVTKTYMGIYKDFLQVEFNPSSDNFKLSDKYKTQFDSIFESIKRI